MKHARWQRLLGWAQRHPALAPTLGLLGLVGCLVLALLVALLVAWVWQWRWAVALQRLEHSAEARLGSDAASLAQLLDKHQHLPRLLSLEPRLLAALQQPRQPAVVLQANRYLAEFGAVTQVQAAYLMGLDGGVIAASNWREPHSYVGNNYGFRPYFLQARDGQAGTFYAIGATTQVPGLFLSQPLRVGAQVLGVVVVKLDLSAVAQAWADSGEQVALADAHGVIFLASNPSWPYRPLGPLAEPALRALAATRPYGDRPLQPLQPMTTPADLPSAQAQAQAQAVTLPNAQGQATDYWLQTRPMDRWGWQLLLARELAPARRAALAEAGVLALAAALAMVALAVWRLQARRRSERQAAAAALAQAHAQLARGIAERTAELTAANQALQARVQALRETEQILQATQNQAVQAGKLAVLGQLAASVTHEINQPLAALATCAGNAVKQLDRGRSADLRDNLQLMVGLAERLGAIVAQLKGFARPGDLNPQPVAVADALGMATLMLAPRLRAAGLSLHTQIDDDATRVLAERTRLEQVLLNLLRNAIDAMASRAAADLPTEAVAHAATTEAPPPAIIELRARRDAAGRVLLQVRDHGPGLSDSALRHLFEPFFTTRARGEGLGLGLTISRAIAQGLGGDLGGENLPAAQGGGALFTLSLPPA